MSTEQQTKLKFISVDFPLVNFQSEKLLRDEQVIDVDITPKVFIPKNNPNVFMIIQDVNVSVEGAFNLNLVAVGNFELINVTDEKMRSSFINMNAPAIMFPYIRAFIATLSSNLGNVTGTLNIPPQFFKGKLEEINDDDVQNQITVSNPSKRISGSAKKASKK